MPKDQVHSVLLGMQVRVMFLMVHSGPAAIMDLAAVGAAITAEEAKRAVERRIWVICMVAIWSIIGGKVESCRRDVYTMDDAD